MPLPQAVSANVRPRHINLRGACGSVDTAALLVTSREGSCRRPCATRRTRVAPDHDGLSAECVTATHLLVIWDAPEDPRLDKGREDGHRRADDRTPRKTEYHEAVGRALFEYERMFSGAHRLDRVADARRTPSLVIPRDDGGGGVGDGETPTASISELVPWRMQSGCVPWIGRRS